MEHRAFPCTYQDDSSPLTTHTCLPTSPTAHQGELPFLSPSLSPPETDDLREMWGLTAETGVRCDLQERISRIGDRTSTMVAMATGCWFELRQQSVIIALTRPPSPGAVLPPH